MRLFVLSAAAVFTLASSDAIGSVIDVTWSGTSLFGSAGGPYSATGGLTFDSEVLGATTNLTAVAIDDPGIISFSMMFSGGTFDQTFVDNTEVVGGFDGSFDLSSFGTFPDIINSTICLQGAGGDHTCSNSNPGGVFTFNTNGTATFSPAAVANSSTEAISLEYTVTAVPLPAGMLLLGTGLGAFGLLRRRSKFQKMKVTGEP